jgi:uncharacterized protein
MAAPLLTGCGPVVRAVGGGFDQRPGLDREQLGPQAEALIARAFEGLDPARVADAHLHHVSTEVRPDWLTWRHPIRRLRTAVYLSAAGLSSGEDLAERHLARVLALAGSFPPGARFFLYALDASHRPDGSPDPDRTPLYVSNESVVEAAARHPERLVPVISVHPHRRDALAELDRFADRGVRFVKWIPNTMGIDPAAEGLAPFYDRMRARGLVLLTHTGRERAAEVVDQELGNPLRLRLPLSRGVTVVALHAASDGTCRDEDRGGRGRVPCFDLLLRLMDEPIWRDTLFAELSAIAFVNHLGAPLRTLLEREDLHHRLVNGSDYPINALNLVVQTRVLVRKGFLEREDGEPLRQIYRYNPLLFDFVLKRSLRHPKTGARFAGAAFEVPPAWLDELADP